MPWFGSCRRWEELAGLLVEGVPSVGGLVCGGRVGDLV
jgi:hypothetical protein